MWGLHSSQDADAGIAGKKHTLKNRITPKHNLIMEAMNAGMSTMSIITSVPVTSAAKSPYTVHAQMMMNYASVKDGDNFELHWTYRNNMLHFKMKCKGLGWCAVGFSTAPGDGSSMRDYDIAVGGVASNMGYLNVSLSTIVTLYCKRVDRML